MDKDEGGVLINEAQNDVMNPCSLNIKWKWSAFIRIMDVILQDFHYQSSLTNSVLVSIWFSHWWVTEFIKSLRKIGFWCWLGIEDKWHKRNQMWSNISITIHNTCCFLCSFHISNAVYSLGHTIVIYFSIWGMARLQCPNHFKSFKKKIIKVMIYEEGRRKFMQYFLTYSFLYSLKKKKNQFQNCAMLS